MCITIVSVDQCHIHMCHRTVEWTSNVASICAIGLRMLIWVSICFTVSSEKLAFQMRYWISSKHEDLLHARFDEIVLRMNTP